MRPAELEGASIVMIGSFNPAIFQPRWLGALQLIRPEEAENATIRVIQAEVADFSTEWFHIQVLQNRFTVETADPRQYGPLRDLASGIFAILPHTPITLIGMNRYFHVKMASQEAWHSIGHQLAPKETWEGIMAQPGLRSMVMEGRRKVTDGGTMHVRIQPSPNVEHGIYLEFNEEFKPADGSDPEGAQWVPARLAEHWDAIMKFAEDGGEHLLGVAKT